MTLPINESLAVRPRAGTAPATDTTSVEEARTILAQLGLELGKTSREKDKTVITVYANGELPRETVRALIALHDKHPSILIRCKSTDPSKMFY